MKLRFTKMHGLGNDFVVVDGITQSVSLGLAERRRVADRRLGVGFDQLLVVEPAASIDSDLAIGSDLAVRIYNRDGTEAEHCGNGLRCVARFARDRGLVNGDVLRLHTAGGLVGVRLLEGGLAQVEMGVPRLEPADVPFLASPRRPSYALNVAGEAMSVGVVSLGNPHAVLRVDDVDGAPVAEIGPRIQCLAHFPCGVNVGFMQVLDRGHIRLRVCERGVGETPACGSGACAAAIVGVDQGCLDPDVTVELPGGVLEVSWEGPGHTVWLLGPTCTVYEGEIAL